MELNGKICVITGAAGGIGEGLARRFAAEGAVVVVSDLDQTKCEAVAAEIGGHARACDVSTEAPVKDLIDWTEANVGPIDLFASNAGILGLGGPEQSDAHWYNMIDINVMSHVWAARHLVPKMIARGGGYLLNTASAAGLLNQPATAAYAVTKHAAVGLAEWLSLTYGDDGIKVGCLCPQAVRSDMTRGFEDSPAAIDGMLEPADVAEATVQAIREEQFLITPHPEVREYIVQKASNYERWLGGMRKLNRMFVRSK